MSKPAPYYNIPEEVKERISAGMRASAARKKAAIDRLALIEANVAAGAWVLLDAKTKKPVSLSEA